MLLLAVGCCRWLPLLSCLPRRRCRRRCLLLLSPLAAPLCLLLLAPSWLPSLPGCSSLASPVPGLLFCFPGPPRVVPCPRSRRLRRSRRPPGLSWALGGLWALVLFFAVWALGVVVVFPGLWLFLLFPLLGLWALLSSGLPHAVSGFPDSVPCMSHCLPLTRRFRISGFQSFSGSMLPLGSLAVLAVPRFAPAGPPGFDGKILSLCPAFPLF